MNKKVICSLTLAVFMAQSLSATGVVVHAKEISKNTTISLKDNIKNSENNSIEESLNFGINVDELKGKDKEIYDKVINESIEKYKNSPDFNKEEFVAEVNYILSLNNNSIRHRSKRSIVSFSNRTVATAANVVICVALGGAGGAAIESCVARYGAEYATNLIARKVTAKLMTLGIRKLSGLDSVVSNIVKNVLDPGSTIAEWLDAHDSEPYNGRVEVG